MKALRIFAIALAAAGLLACGKQTNESPGNSGGTTEPGPTVARRPPTPPSVDAKVARGKAVYDETGCATCHAIGGIGGTIGPKLDGIAAKYD